MEPPVDIRYAGVIVARASEVRSPEGGRGLFLVVSEPLPVGTVIGLGADDQLARVERVVESVDAALAGMLVRPLGANGESVAVAPVSPPPSEGIEPASLHTESAAGPDNPPPARPLPPPDGRRRNSKRRR